MAKKRRGRKKPQTPNWQVQLGRVMVGVVGALLVLVATWQGFRHHGYVLLGIGGTIGVVGLIALLLAAYKPHWVPPVAKWVWRHTKGKPVALPQPVVPPRPIATSREPMPAGLRFAVLHRDGFRCRYCGRGQDDGVKLHIDHLVAVANGGKTELGNLVTACSDCNLGKSKREVIETVATVEQTEPAQTVPPILQEDSPTPAVPAS